MNSCSDFLHTFCVYVLHMFSELERLRAPAGRLCDNHVIGTWWVISWSVVKARSLDISWMWERVYVSYYHSSLLEFVSRFGRQNRNPLSSLRTLLNLQTSSPQTSSLRTLLSLRTLSSLQTWEIRLERRVEPAGNESGWLWLVWSPWSWRERSLTTRKFDWWWHERPFDNTKVRPVTRGDRGLVHARPSTRWTLGRVDSRFVWEFVYRVAYWRDRRPTSLKDIFWRRIFISIIRLFL